MKTKKKKKVNRKLIEQQSMTASERKRARSGAEDEIIPEPDPAAVAEQKKTRNRIILVALPILLTIIVVVSVVIPVWSYSDYRYADNPIVVMELDNGMTLKYEVYVSDAPNLAANFLFLCRIGYFNDNIVFDTQEFWIRFGGYYLDEDGSYAHRKDDKALISAKSQYFGEKAGADTQFKYKVNKDALVKYNTQSEMAKYGLFGNYTSYCSEYSIMGRVGTLNRFTSESNRIITYGLEYLAKAYDTETEENIESMLGLERSDGFYRGWFKTADNPFIKIISTKVHNYEVPYSKNFEKYMSDSNAISASWTDTYL